MRRNLIALVFTALVFSTEHAMAGSFLEEQKRFPRVRAALRLKEETVRRTFAAAKVAYPPKSIYLRAFKASGKVRLAAGDGKIELWARDTSTGTFRFVQDFRVCYHSGGLGPKRKAGDGQVPEGFYVIDRFNPTSQFHLSLGLDYPNASDRILGVRGSLGGDIFIHGSCVSIGCLAITDDKIRELYLIAVAARDGGQRRIPVHIFPAPLTDSRLRELEAEGRRRGLWEFWNDLKAGYDAFERTRIPPEFKVGEKGRYVIQTR